MTSFDGDVELGVPALGQRQVAGLRAVRVRERPGELDADDLDLERVRAGVAVLREHDRADDRDRGHEHGRDRRPGDLEPRVAVGRRPVRVVVRAGRGTSRPSRREPRRRPRRRRSRSRSRTRRRSRCAAASLPAATGSHGITSATAVVIAAASNPEQPELDERTPAHPRVEGYCNARGGASHHGDPGRIRSCASWTRFGTLSDHPHLIDRPCARQRTSVGPPTGSVVGIAVPRMSSAGAARPAAAVTTSWTPRRLATRPRARVGRGCGTLRSADGVIAATFDRHR